MSRSGDELGTDLGALYEAGQYKVVPLAEEIRAAGSLLLNAPDTASLLARHSTLGGFKGPVSASWEELRDAVVDLLVTSADNIEDTGQALLLAAEEYAKTDDEAARQYRRLKSTSDQVWGS